MEAHAAGDEGYRDLTALRWAFSVAALLIVVVAVASDPGEPWQIVLVVTAAAAIVAWGLYPALPPMALTVAVLVPVVAVGTHLRMEAGLFLVSLTALIVAGSDVSRRTAAVTGTLLVSSPAVIAFLQVPDRSWSWWIWMIGILFPFVMGRVYRRQVLLAAELERARRELADQAVLEERRRIARDVHDLVGHGLSAVLLQVTGARHVLRRDLDAADEALRVAEDAGRRSLADLRRTIGALRAEGESGLDAPLPVSGGLEELLAEARAWGLDVHADLHVSAGTLDGTVGVALHRIAQEALVNARRHAPRARTEVRVRADGDHVHLTVDSLGLLEPDGDHEGYGLVGMRERAAAAGGTFEAGPVPGGWRVACWIPPVGPDTGGGPDAPEQPAPGASGGDATAPAVDEAVDAPRP